jgi:hypothetical protein
MQIFKISLCVLVLLAGSVGVVDVALADDASKMAEKLRLEEELKKLAQRNAWAGVERKYLELLRLKVELPFEDHEIGSQSAGFLGKTYEVYERLQRAQELEDRKDINNSIAHIDSNFGRIDIQGHEKRRPDLNPQIMPFAPDQRKSIEWARTVMKNTGSFHGMLPAGDYIVCTQSFTVAPGPDFLVVKLKKFSAKELKECGVEDGKQATIEYSGPIARLGFTFMSSPQPLNKEGQEVNQKDICGGEKCNGSETDGYGAQPESFSGGGVSLMGGYELGFNQVFGLTIEAGYTNMLDGKSPNGNSGNFNAFYTGVGAVFRPGDARIGFGPIFGLYLGSGKGVSDWYDIGQDQDRNPNLTQPWKGLSGTVGGQLSFGYGLMDFGKLQGVVELGGSWETDGTRQFINAGLRVGIVPLIERFKQ